MRLSFLIAAGAACCATPALAQPSDQPGALLQPNEQPGLPKNYLQVGLGVAVNPDYDGSDDYRFIPGAVFRARYRGVDIATEGLGLSADLVSTGRRIDFDLGPAITLNLNRTGGIDDRVVDRLPQRDAAVEVGGFAGISISKLTNPFDSLSLRVKATHDIAGAHGSTIVTPSLTYGTPLSLTTFVGASVSAEFVSDDYADYYFSVSPADTLASGLRTFDADGGMKEWSLGLILGQSLSGDLRKGWSLFGLANYSRLVGDFKRSPLVADRGSANQWFGAVGVGYSW